VRFQGFGVWTRVREDPHARSGGRREPGIIFLEFGYMLGGINYPFISVKKALLGEGESGERGKEACRALQSFQHHKQGYSDQ
jgi:hypothetical protein